MKPGYPYIVSDKDGFQSLQISENVRRIPIKQPETIREAEVTGAYVAPGLRVLSPVEIYGAEMRTER